MILSQNTPKKTCRIFTKSTNKCSQFYIGALCSASSSSLSLSIFKLIVKRCFYKVINFNYERGKKRQRAIASCFCVPYLFFHHLLLSVKGKKYYISYIFQQLYIDTKTLLLVCCEKKIKSKFGK